MLNTIVESRYRITKFLGQGGMARVYQAKDLNLGRDVALKMMPSDLAETRQFVSRFKREFEVCASLSHPNIIKLYDCGKVDDTHSRYYTMELLECPDLSTMIAENGTLSQDFVTAMIRQILNAFDCYHVKSIVHRDLKPSNIMIDSTTRVVITDFGLVYDGARTAITQEGSIVGTPVYYAPEMVTGSPVSPQTDYFQLGVIVYECLTGTLPFKGNTFLDLANSITKSAPIPVTNIRHTLPRQWNTIINRFLAKDPAQRYQTSGEVLVDLLTLEDTPVTRESTHIPSKKNLLPRAIAVFLAIAAVYIASVYLNRPHPNPSKGMAQALEVAGHLPDTSHGVSPHKTNVSGESELKLISIVPPPAYGKPAVIWLETNRECRLTIVSDYHSRKFTTHEAVSLSKEHDISYYPEFNFPIFLNFQATYKDQTSKKLSLPVSAMQEQALTVLKNLSLNLDPGLTYAYAKSSMWAGKPYGPDDKGMLWSISLYEGMKGFHEFIAWYSFLRLLSKGNSPQALALKRMSFRLNIIEAMAKDLKANYPFSLKKGLDDIYGFTCAYGTFVLSPQDQEKTMEVYHRDGSSKGPLTVEVTLSPDQANGAGSVAVVTTMDTIPSGFRYFLQINSHEKILLPIIIEKYADQKNIMGMSTTSEQTYIQVNLSSKPYNLRCTLPASVLVPGTNTIKISLEKILPGAPSIPFDISSVYLTLNH